MARKRRLLRDSSRVSIRDLKPIEIERKKRTFHWSTKGRILTVIMVCAVLMISTLLAGNYLAPAGSFLRTVTTPVQQVLNRVGAFFQGLPERVQENDRLKSENETLQKENEALKYANALQEVQLQKLTEIARMYELETYYADYPKTGAEIVSVAPNNWYQSITVNKGASEGIFEFAPVLSGGGLLGYVDTVDAHTSQITTILAEGSFVYGDVLRSGARVGVNGSTALQPEGLCYIEFLIGEVDITVGDVITTSGMSTVYPPGIRVGEVVEIREKGDGINALAYVRPYAKTEGITYVLIMTDPLPAKEESDVSGEESLP